MTRRPTAALCLGLLTLPCAAAAQDRAVAQYQGAVEGPQPASGINPLAALTIPELMQRFNVPGVSVAVIRNFAIHWARGYGIADMESGAPVDAETMFQAASISKPVAAMGVLKAVQDGVFGLDQDINTIRTSWQLPGGEFTGTRPVTPRMLTSHTLSEAP